MMCDMKHDDRSPEQAAKAQTCKTPENVLALAKEEGLKLTDEELQAVAGGGDWEDIGALNIGDAPTVYVVA